MKKTLSIALAAAVSTTLPVGAADGSDLGSRIREAERILSSVPLIDGHNDLPWKIRSYPEKRFEQFDLRADTRATDSPTHTDIERLRAGKVGAQFWSVYVPVDLEGAVATKTTFEQIDIVHRLNERYPETFTLALDADDIRQIHRSGRIASLIGMEGGHSIDNSLAVLRQFHAAGARYMTLTHWKGNDWADAATDEPRHGGLSKFGEEVVREMNRLGMLVDLSHVSEETMHDALDVSAAPVIFSHSSSHGVTPHPRNVPDSVLKRLKEKDGVVMVTFVPGFISSDVREWGAARDAEEARLKALHPGSAATVQTLLAKWIDENPSPRATISDVADHIDHVRSVAGIDHIGIGSDFDGIRSTPVDLESVEDFPALFAELLRRGYRADDLRKIAGLNVLRVMDKNEAIAARLQKERRPSDAKIEDFQ